MNRIFTVALVACLAQSSSGEVPKEVREGGVAATVRVTNKPDATGGSGVLIARQGSHAYVLTAQHLVPKADVVEVTFRKMKPIRAEVLARSAELDIAIVRLPAPEDLAAPMPFAALGAMPGKAISVGWQEGEMATVDDESVKGTMRLRRPGEAKAVLCWETERKPVPGRSGGPLLDQAGSVLGIASGHDGSVGYYIHMDAIRSFLRANALNWLVENDR